MGRNKIELGGLMTRLKNNLLPEGKNKKVTVMLMPALAMKLSTFNQGVELAKNALLCRVDDKNYDTHHLRAKYCSLREHRRSHITVLIPARIDVVTPAFMAGVIYSMLSQKEHKNWENEARKINIRFESTDLNRELFEIYDMVYDMVGQKVKQVEERFWEKNKSEKYGRAKRR